MCPATNCALLAETLLYPRFSGRHNLKLRRAYVKGQAENMLILRCTHLNLGGNKYFKYPQSSTRPFDVVGANRWMCVCVYRRLNSPPPAGQPDVQLASSKPDG